MRWLCAVLIGVVMSGGSALAQMAMPMVVAETDRVGIGPVEYVPRFARLLPNSLTVPAGQTVTLAEDSEFDAIEVAGTLRCARDRDTRLKVTHLLILVGGRWDCGTEADPVLRKVEIIIRDVPIDFDQDPFQWSNGIVNFGTQTRVGRAMARTWTVLAQDVQAGATTLTTEDEVSAGWSVGDELLLPDMKPPSAGPRRESPVTIAAITGNTITLSKPLDFAHESVSRPDGAVIVRPRVANLTRNIVLRSENPEGTRGHTVNIGPAASWDVRYNQFVGLGRTQATTINSTSTDTMGAVLTIGTNQIAKYADHDHHTGTSLAVRNTIGNSYNGTKGSKWAKVVHVTHDVVVEDNVCIDFQGGCFTTEDGYESRNVFRRNVAAYSFRVMDFDAGNQLRSNRNNPGGEGSGFWFRGIHNTIEGNEAWNNVTGINLFNQNQIAITSKIPSVKGGPSDVAFNRRTMVPLSIKDNVTIGNSFVGLEFWATPRFYVENHISVNNGLRQAWAANSTGVSFLFKNLQTWGGDEGVSGSQGYVDDLEILGGYLGGSRMALPNGMAARLIHIKDVTLQSTFANIQSHGGARQTFENVMHLPFGSATMQPIIGIGAAGPETPPWKAGDPLPTDGKYSWFTHLGPRTTIINWQGTGQDYTLFSAKQLRSLDAWPAHPYNAENVFYVPERGLTMGQAWDKYGMAFGGAVIEDGVGLTIEGLPGLARPGRAYPLGTPKTVMTMPSVIEPLPAGQKSVSLYFLLTGDPAQANNVGAISIDGGPTIRMTSALSTIAPGQRRHVITTLTDGAHKVLTWRESPTGQKIPASEMLFPFTVGAPTEPLPTPVNCVQGQWTVSVTGAWSEWATVGDHQERTRTITETRVTTTQPANGGTPCGSSTQTRTETETRPIPPPAWVDAVVQISPERRIRVCPVGQPESACVVLP